MPASPHRVVLLRRIEAIDGDARVSVHLDLRADFGRGQMTDLTRHSISKHGVSKHGGAEHGTCGPGAAARPGSGGPGRGGRGASRAGWA